MANPLEYLIGVEDGDSGYDPPGVLRYAVRGNWPNCPVFCGFVGGTIRTETIGLRRGKWRVNISDRLIDEQDAAVECIIIHQDASQSSSIDSQIVADSEIWEIEVRLKDCGFARRAADDILKQIEADGVLQSVVTRYDEPGGEINGKSFGSHSLVVQLLGSCPDIERGA